jgi:PAS domain S-box-containing protein
VDRVRSTVVWLLVVALAYYLSAELSLRFSLVEDNVTPLWPPSGVAVVALLLGGRRLWPAIAIAAFAVNAPIGASVLGAAVTAAGNTVAPLVAAEILARVGFRRELDRLGDAVSMVAVALGTMVISATVGAALLVASDAIAPARFAGAWAVWWAGDAMGVLVVAPFLLTVGGAWRLVTDWARAVEAVVVFGVLLGACALAYTSQLPLLFLVLPILGWAAWRFQQAGAAPATLLVCGLAAYAASQASGPFGEGNLLERMVTLQAFNASVTLTSFVFAALVAERSAQRFALEGTVDDLEGRVQAGMRDLADRERWLAELRATAEIGTWAWDLQTGEVTWSDELYRIHGHEPGGFTVTFERAMAQVREDDVVRIRANVEGAIRAGAEEVPAIEYRIRRPDGSERTLRGSGSLRFRHGEPVGMLGVVHDLTQRRRFEQDHVVAETLQRALLPPDLPEVDGVTLSARYVPAERDLSAGGDWYDAIALADGKVGCVIGDVAGHGLRAASVMAQLRMAIRALAVEGADPGRIAAALNRQLARAAERDMATMLYLEIDPATGRCSLVNAGHPPAIVLEEGRARFLSAQPSLPLGVEPAAVYLVEEMTLPPGATLVLFTDGLVERHDVPLEAALERARALAETHGRESPPSIAQALRDRLVPAQPSDDVAIMVVRIASTRPAFRMRVPAHPAELATIRGRLRRFLEEAGVSGEALEELVLACNEAAANAIVHAYGARAGDVSIEAGLMDGRVWLTIGDAGTWQERRRGGGGHGLRLIEACTDAMEIVRTSSGTEVRLGRAVGAAAS